ncbi:oligosaccharide flippase family protein [Loigolactobacillus coryniformis]|uniref:Polysaccharide biosynthesis family protein n=4 Tax=Loigolactobacillus coryniformis TaxID=1610 RepID=J3ENP5_9LACO|nr:oligosaccharide flippase family protein [Loigolactobacillus coryniformis]MDT3392055.1 oligosaccharide flippase family protein [Bacillota bacterium]RRG05229.1 MAG: polysaccharide biosynthesis protein [Lactobacillus sp.]ATO44139.1 transporter [Loigolactobacillus coryniformis subsp. torquens DSM 20004 = KCTC 3535]ATO55806.1 transporter [Loigolactobacillus coryniformis subsp. coryniformis KCTC 3167 = DSM 20001]EJN54540.1 Polysaccharide biosynthesis family protein [Loigolactobacillus coryniformi
MAKQPEEKTTTSKEKMLRGSAWMTAGSMFSRILGALYVIPWMMWFGRDRGQANALFAIGYNIYSIFLIISTAGIPGAVAKQVSHYNAMNEYKTGRKLFRSGLYLMVFMGVISAAALYLLAPWISTGDKDAIPVIRSLAWPLLVIPMMSLFRGFFQGYQDMAPSAVSQFIEQVARVIYMLVTAYWIMQVMHGSYVTAVAHSTFAAFIGAVASLLVLAWYYLRKRKEWDVLADNSADTLDISTRDMLMEMVRQAIPFIILDAGITIFQLVDQYTFFNMIDDFVVGTRATFNTLYSLFAFNANKLIMIIVSLAASMAITSIPLLSEAYTKRDFRDVRDQVDNTIELFFFIMIPSAIGMAAVAKPLYTIFYGYDFTGTLVLEFSSYTSIVLGLFTVLAAMLQGLYQNRLAIAYFVVGLVVKIVVQYPMIYLFKVFGPLMATAIGFMVASYLMINTMNNMFHLKVAELIKFFSETLLFALVMYAVCIGLQQVLYLFLNPASRVQSMLVIVLVAGVGATLYGYLVLKSRLGDQLLGSRIAGLRRRLRIK